jgi:hypothetical protein
MYKIHFEFSVENWMITSLVSFNKVCFSLLYIHFLYIDLLSSTPANETEELTCVMNARLLYDTCINETKIETDGIEPVLSLINELGGWPILQGSSWNSTTYNLSNLLFRLRQYNYNIIFRINTDVDEKNSSETDIVVSSIDYQIYRTISVVLDRTRFTGFTTTSVFYQRK